MFLHFSVLQELLSDMVCKECFETVSLTEIASNCMGFSYNLQIKCEHCSYKRTFYTSPKCKSSKAEQTSSPYEVNTRSVIAFHEIGCGHASIKTFASCMNIKCISEPGFPKDKQNCHVSI